MAPKANEMTSLRLRTRINWPCCFTTSNPEIESSLGLSAFLLR
jgi:hypothetical protein